MRGLQADTGVSPYADWPSPTASLQNDDGHERGVYTDREQDTIDLKRCFMAR